MKKSAIVQCVLITAALAAANYPLQVRAASEEPVADNTAYQQTREKKDSTGRQNTGVVRSGFGRFFHHSTHAGG